MAKNIKGTKLDAFELNILAAIFARSNMGQGLPAKKDVERFKANTDWRTKELSPPTLDTCVNGFCGRFMESDEHYDWFMKEAKWWLSSFKKTTAEVLAHNHPHIAELYWRDAATYVDDKRFPNG
jgi:hypothetical protein